MPDRQCHHCKQWVAAGEPHDCWTTTESALTRDLSDDLREAWERLRESAVEFGDQKIYASHHSIMFSREACYCFVRPKRSYLELCVFLGREVKARQIKRAVRASKIKIAHLIQIRHRDEVESPITDWMREAYRLPDDLARRRATRTSGSRAKKPAARAVRPRATKRARRGRPAK